MAAGLFIQRWGSGRPVLFLHGLGASGRYWERVRKAAGDSYAGTAPDLLGFGRSPAPEDATYDVDCHVDALTPEVTPGSLVVAHSTGGIVALRLPARRPDLVASLLLIGLPAFPSEEVARAEVGRLGLMARLTVDGNPLAKRACELMCRFRPLLLPGRRSSSATSRRRSPATQPGTRGARTTARSSASS